MKQQHNEQEQRRKRIRRIIVIIFTLMIIIALTVGYWLLQTVMKPNVHTPGGDEFSLYIPTGATYNQVIDSLQTHHLVNDIDRFEWLAKKKDYPDHDYSPFRDHIYNENIVEYKEPQKAF